MQTNDAFHGFPTGFQRRKEIIQIFKFGSLLPRDACISDRSREDLSDEYLFAKTRFDTAENESSKVCHQVVRQSDELS